MRSRYGQFLVRVPARPGVWRLAWGSLTSREATGRAAMIGRAVLATAALLLMAAPAHAASNLEVGMEDERLLLSEPVHAETAIAGMAAAGVDVVRIHARWIDVSPGRDSRRRPRGFDLADHRSRRYDWQTLDRAVDLTRAAGMRVMLSVTGPGPLWTSLAPARGNPRYKPSPRLFAHFARAVATRYRDRVDRYLIWNEPNVAGWLEPQQTCVARRVCFPASPHIYRGLVRAARPAIERADPGAQVLLGELAPRGAQGDLDALAGVAAAVPARAGVRGPALQADAARAVPRLPARAGGRLRLPPARRRVRARGPQPRPRPGADRRPPAAVLACSTGSRGWAASARRAAASTST